jgi:2-polyprenyl-6-hydroxyphenyl methylase/3-demethylubiquinone-9 3-methyltransferase
VGCGGGLLSEGLAASGARVTGIDMAEASLAVARDHMQTSGLDIDYRQTTAEAHADEKPGTTTRWSAWNCSNTCPGRHPSSMPAPGWCAPAGDLFFATVNRTWLAWLLVIVAAERVMGIVRKGTHEYKKLVKPEELKRWGVESGLTVENLSGLRYIPFGGHAALCRSTGMNYLMHFRKETHGSLEEPPLV